MSSEPTHFRVCSICRKEIGFEQTWYRCSVTTCNRGKTALFFCSVDRWSAHVPVVRHRDAWAEQEKAPTRQAWLGQLQQEEEREARGPAVTASAAIGVCQGVLYFGLIVAFYAGHWVNLPRVVLAMLLMESVPALVALTVLGWGRWRRWSFSPGPLRVRK